MSSLVYPAITGGALLALFYGPPEVRQQLDVYLAKLPFKVTQGAVILTLQILTGLGINGVFTAFMNWLAFRNWKIFLGGKPWKWDEEIAVVTGGSGGIATAINEKLLKKGIRVAILDIAPPSAEMLKNPKVKFFQCDLTNSKSVHECAEKIKKEWGNPTILVNNAGIAIGMPILEISDKQLEKIFNINIIAHWYTVREFLPGMIKAQKGHIVTVASMASYTGVAGIVDYCATKSGALAFHEGLTQEIRHLYKAPFIRTSCAHPFWTTTNMTNLIEEGIKKTDTLVTADYVGGVIAKQILSGTGGHMIIPDYNIKLRMAPLVRGLPSWINARANDSTKDNILYMLGTPGGKDIAKARYN